MGHAPLAASFSKQRLVTMLLCSSGWGKGRYPITAPSRSGGWLPKLLCTSYWVHLSHWLLPVCGGSTSPRVSVPLAGSHLGSKLGTTRCCIWGMPTADKSTLHFLLCPVCCVCVCGGAGMQRSLLPPGGGSSSPRCCSVPLARLHLCCGVGVTSLLSPGSRSGSPYFSASLPGSHLGHGAGYTCCRLWGAWVVHYAAQHLSLSPVWPWDERHSLLPLESWEGSPLFSAFLSESHLGHGSVAICCCFEGGGSSGSPHCSAPLSWSPLGSVLVPLAAISRDGSSLPCFSVPPALPLLGCGEGANCCHL